MAKAPKKTQEQLDEDDEREAFDDALRQILGAPEPRKKKTAPKKRGKTKRKAK